MHARQETEAGEALRACDAGQGVQGRQQHRRRAYMFLSLSRLYIYYTYVYIYIYIYISIHIIIIITTTTTISCFIIANNRDTRSSSVPDSPLPAGGVLREPVAVGVRPSGI